MQHLKYTDAILEGHMNHGGSNLSSFFYRFFKEEHQKDFNESETFDNLKIAVSLLRKLMAVPYQTGEKTLTADTVHTLNLFGISGGKWANDIDVNDLKWIDMCIDTGHARFCGEYGSDTSDDSED